MLYARTWADSNQCTHANPKRGYIGIEYGTKPLFNLRKSETIDELVIPSEYYKLSSENKLKRILHVHEFCLIKKKEKKMKQSIREKLVKANRSNFKSKFFVFISDVVSSYIKYWKTIGFGRVDLDD